MASLNVDDLGRVVKVEFAYKYKANDGRIISIEEEEEFVLIKKSNADWWQVIRSDEKKPIYIPAAYVRETTAKRYPDHTYFKKAYQALQKAKRKQRPKQDAESHRLSTRPLPTGNERLIALSRSREDLTVLSASPDDLKFSELRASTDSLDKFIENENPYDEVPYEPSRKFERDRAPCEEPEYENLETIQKSVDKHSSMKKSLKSSESETDLPTSKVQTHSRTTSVVSDGDDQMQSSPTVHRSVGHSPQNSASGKASWELRRDTETGSKCNYDSNSGEMRVKDPQQANQETPGSPQYDEEISFHTPVPPAVPDASKKPTLDRSQLSPFSDEEMPIPLQRRRTSPARYKNSNRSALTSRGAREHFAGKTVVKKPIEDPWSPNREATSASPTDSTSPVSSGEGSNNRNLPRFNYVPPISPENDRRALKSKHKKTNSDFNPNRIRPDSSLSPTSAHRASHKARSSSFTGDDAKRFSHAANNWRRERSPDGEMVFIHEITGDRWYRMTDEQTGNFYYFNEVTRQTSWQLPETDAHDYDEQAAENDRLDIDSDNEQRVTSLPEERRVTLSSRKANTLERDSGLQVHSSPSNHHLYQQQQLTTSSLPANVSPPQAAEGALGKLKPRQGRKFGRQVDRVMHARSMILLTETQHDKPTVFEESGQQEEPRLKSSLSECNLLSDTMIERQGRLNWTKLVEAGKKQRKNWVQQWVVLLANNLLFYKDQKQATTTKTTPHGKPESSCDLHGALVDWAKDKSSKKNVLELQTLQGLTLLLQHDDLMTITRWLSAIKSTIEKANKVDPVDPLILQQRLAAAEEGEEENDSKKKKDKKKKSKPPSRHGSDAKNSDKVRTKLKKFIGRRPTMESLQERGIIQENVFGCPLDKLCEKEKSSVPQFIRLCVEEVEKRGLDVDGIYRVSGNLSHVQKLRYMIDREEPVDLSDPQWEDIHLVTGALKMFLRELPEPVIPFNFFDKFIAACKIQDASQRIMATKKLVQVLPKANGKTLEYLMQHFCKVVQYSSKNRMQIQNVAIVFGPTLLVKPPDESGGGSAGHMAVYMVFQNQIVDYMLSEYREIFGK